MYRLTESDFRFDNTLSSWRLWRHFTQKSAATWWVNTKRLPGAYAAAYAGQFLIYSTLMLVFMSTGVVFVCRFRHCRQQWHATGLRSWDNL